MPGRATSPTANRELISGIMAARKAARRDAKYSSVFRSDSNRSAARLTVFIALAKIMPASGIM